MHINKIANFNFLFKKPLKLEQYKIIIYRDDIYNNYDIALIA